MQVQAEDITDLTIETVTFDNGNPGLSAVEEAVNQITIPAIGVRIHLLDVGIQQHAQRISMMIESGEPVDLVMAGLTLPMVSMVADELLRMGRTFRVCSAISWRRGASIGSCMRFPAMRTAPVQAA